MTKREFVELYVIHEQSSEEACALVGSSIKRALEAWEAIENKVPAGPPPKLTREDVQA